MQVVGLIAEYNPFHNGHLYHLREAQKITKSEKVIIVLSGNFVQRGAPAAFDKYLRTKWALLAGADMVLELPIYYALSSAAYFAQGAIKILNDTGIVNSLCFGSEDGTLIKLDPVADLLLNEPPEFKTTIKNSLNCGLSYPKAREIAITNILGQENGKLMNQSNNILGIEYLKSLKKSKSTIKPYTIKRLFSQYNSIDSFSSTLSSATAIRYALKNKEYHQVSQNMPFFSFSQMQDEIFNLRGPVEIDDFTNILHYIIRMKKAIYLKTILDVDEGLENRLISASENNYPISDILLFLKSKRYTMSKLRRVIMHILLDITKEDFQQFQFLGGPRYIRVLGFRKESEILFKLLKQNASLPVLTNIKDAPKILDHYGIKMLEKEIVSTDIYNTARKSFALKPAPINYEYKQPLIII